MKKSFDLTSTVDFPFDWKQKSFVSFCKLITKQTGFDYSATIKPSLQISRNKSNIPMLQTKNFKGRNFTLDTDFFIPKPVANVFPKILLNEKCLLFSIVGASVGNIGLYDGKAEVFLGGAICISKFINTEDAEFIYYVMISEIGQRQIRQITKGGGQATITIEDIRKLVIPSPPCKEQKKIAEILRTIDEKIELIEQQIAETQNLKKGLMQTLLIKGIGHTKFKKSSYGDIPQSWEIIPIYELRNKNDRYGFTGGPFGSDLKSEHYTKNGVKIIQLQNIGEGRFIDKGIAFTSENKANELHSCNIFPDEIILAKMAPVARCCKVPSTDERYVMCSDGIRLSVDRNKYDNEFVYQALNSKYFRNEAEAKSTGSTRARIGLKELKQIPILIPKDIAEQKKIATILKSVDEKSEVLSEKKTHYQELRQGLMQQLLTGKIRVKV